MLAASLLVVSETGTRRYESTDDHVLFQSTQVIPLARHGSFGQNTRGLLERGSRNKALSRKGGFGNPQQFAVGSRRNQSFGFQPIALLQEGGVLSLLAFDEGGVACRGNLDLTEPLPNNDFDMLVIDLNTLLTVDLLNLIDDVLGQCRDAFETKNVVGTQRALRDDFTLLNRFALKY